MGVSRKCRGGGLGPRAEAVEEVLLDRALEAARAVVVLAALRVAQHVVGLVDGLEELRVAAPASARGR
jgi:hypothetical protein